MILMKGENYQSETRITKVSTEVGPGEIWTTEPGLATLSWNLINKDVAKAIEEGNGTYQPPANIMHLIDASTSTLTHSLPADVIHEPTALDEVHAVFVYFRRRKVEKLNGAKVETCEWVKEIKYNSIGDSIGVPAGACHFRVIPWLTMSNIAKETANISKAVSVFIETTESRRSKAEGELTSAGCRRIPDIWTIKDERGDIENTIQMGFNNKVPYLNPGNFCKGRGKGNKQRKDAPTEEIFCYQPVGTRPVFVTIATKYFARKPSYSNVVRGDSSTSRRLRKFVRCSCLGYASAEATGSLCFHAASLCFLMVRH